MPLFSLCRKDYVKVKTFDDAEFVVKDLEITPQFVRNEATYVSGWDE